MIYLLVLLHTITSTALGFLFGYSTQAKKARRTAGAVRVLVLLFFAYLSMEILATHPGPDHMALIQVTFWFGILMFAVGSYIGFLTGKEE